MSKLNFAGSNSNQTSYVNTNTNANTKNRFEKFMTKLIELFLPSSSNTATPEAAAPTDLAQSKTLLKSSRKSLLNSHTISSYYYGYKSNNFIENYNGDKNKKWKQQSKDTQIADSLYKTGSSSNSRSSIGLDSIYDSSSVSTFNNESKRNSLVNSNLYSDEQFSSGDKDQGKESNPFFDKSLTDLISFKSDLKMLNNIFEPWLNTIDG